MEFRHERDDGEPGPSVAVQSRSGFIDNPRSDAQGRLRAVVEPGERVYSVGKIPESIGYPQQSPQKRVVLPAGQTVTVRFKLEVGVPAIRGAFVVARLMHDGDWNVNSLAVTRVSKALGQRLGPNKVNEIALRASDPRLIYCPLLYLHGRGAFAFSAQDVAALRRYLDPGGGTLFADAACGNADFDAAFRRLVAELYPKQPLVAIPRDDPFFADPTLLDLSKSQYTKAAGGSKGLPQLEGVTINDHWGIIYSKLGIGCALDREHDGGCKGYMHDDAVKIGVDVLIYSTLP